ncbi:MAG: glycosyltransferase family 4 protein [Candidatus Coatesbacteria bacterium]|nr:glycosyltransferase family 4 protein [Candidatus Coatesbacteria bacterium]
MKHICFVSLHPRYISGGAENQTLITARGFVKSGWKVSFITPEINPIQHNINDPEIEIYTFPLLHKFSGKTVFMLSWLYMLFDFWKIVKEINADVYYLGLAFYQIGLLARFCRKNNKILLWMIASQGDPDPVEVEKSFIESRPYGISKLNVFVNSIRNFFSIELFKYGVRNTDIILAQNNLQKEAIKRIWNKECFIVYNPWVPLIDRIPDKDNTIVWVGNCRPIKRPEFFCYAAGMLRHLKARFLLIGSQYPFNEDQEALYNLMKDTGVEYIGYVPLILSEEYIAKAKIIVNTSESEGFPNTFIQAWLYETGVVSMNADPDMLLSERGFGLLGDTTEKLAENIKILFENESLRKEITNKARIFAQCETDQMHVVNKIKDIIGSCKKK